MLIRFSVIIISSVFLFSNASADVSYYYTGKPYKKMLIKNNCGSMSLIPRDQCPRGYTATMKVTGRLTFATEIPPNTLACCDRNQITSYSFSDGVNTISSDKPGSWLGPVSISVDGKGKIVAYNFNLVYSPVNQVFPSTGYQFAPSIHLNAMGKIGNDIVAESPNCNVETANSKCISLGSIVLTQTNSAGSLKQGIWTKK